MSGAPYPWTVASQVAVPAARPEPSLNQLALIATLNCLVGCATGEISGMVVGTSATIFAGVDVVYLSKQLGHTDPSVTLDIYADLFEAREKAESSRKALEASYSGLI
jgi:hypothetical protein